MAYDPRGLDDYVDVATRIAEFRAQYPGGRLSPLFPGAPYEVRVIEGTDKDGITVRQIFIVVVAAAYRDPEDTTPGVGMAWEVFPGRTPYTRGSELMNAETSAWGRAIVAALAADTRKGIASREEVRNRREDGLPSNADGSLSRRRTSDEEKAAAGVMTAGQQKEHTRLQPGREPGRAERLAVVPAEDPWYEPEHTPGSVTSDVVWRIAAECQRLGVKGRDERLNLMSALTGRTIASSKELSLAEAQRILADLKERKAEDAAEENPADPS
jgi:hypothetical protein